MAIRNILFDFDGTLADTAPGIVATMRATFEKMNLPVPTDEEMRQTIGIPLSKALLILQGFSDEDALHAVDIYTDLFMTIELGHTKIFPGVCETIKTLAERGIRIAIVTSRNVESLEVILERFGIRQYFETMVTHSDHLTPKPAPDMVLTLLDRMNISKEETLVVGDTTFDIEMGNSAGCYTCAVTYGNHPKEKIMESNPNFVIDSFAELTQIVEVES